MSFVDDLKSMPSEAEKKEEERIQQYRDDLRSIHACIKDACVKKREDRNVKGFIYRWYDGEYCVRGIRWTTSLARDNAHCIKGPSQFHKKGSKFSASLVSDAYYRHREGNEPLSEKLSDCKMFIDDLRPLLKNDGFSDFKLYVYECYDEYDLVKYKGVWAPKPYLEHHISDTFLGFTIQFELSW